MTKAIMKTDTTKAPMPRIFEATWRTAVSLLCCCASTAFAAHPLITEDTGTQGAGNWQLELTHGHAIHRLGTMREQNDSSAAVLSYGVNEPLDLILTVTYERIKIDDSVSTSINRGLGDVELAAKWRFLESGSTSLALRPGLRLPTGNEDKGLGTGRVAGSLFAVLTHEPGDWAFHLHLGYTLNRNVLGERRHLYHCSLAATYRSSSYWLWVADFSCETDPDPSSNEHIRSAVFGTIWSVRPNLDVDMGYRKGFSDNTPDHTWLVGLAYRF